MSKMNAAYTAEHYFAALKLIEQLYKDGEIPAYMFRNILKDYADVVDLPSAQAPMKAERRRDFRWMASAGHP